MAASVDTPSPPHLKQVSFRLFSTPFFFPCFFSFLRWVFLFFFEYLFMVLFDEIFWTWLSEGSSFIMGSSPLISPSSDKRFWSALRSRTETLLENRQSRMPSEPSAPTHLVSVCIQPFDWILCCSMLAGEFWIDRLVGFFVDRRRIGPSEPIEGRLAASDERVRLRCPHSLSAIQ